MTTGTVATGGGPDPSTRIGATEQAREKALALGLCLDLAIWIPFLAIAVWSNSLTMMGDVIRGAIFISLGAALLLTLRRIHRGQTTAYDFGTGKVEQFANLAVGAALIGAAIWVATGMIARAANPPSQPDLGLAFAVAASAANLLVNLVALRSVWRAAQDGTSIIMAAQLRARLSKAAASALVTLAVLVNAAAGAGELGTMADLAGAGLITLMMASVGIGMWRDSLPSLLDRTIDEQRQVVINRALAGHFAEYEALGTVRARLSGRDPQVEISLGFAPSRSVAEVQALGDSLRAELGRQMPGARVTIVPFVAETRPGRPGPRRCSETV